jgi:hypothetical protein
MVAKAVALEAEQEENRIIFEDSTKVVRSLRQRLEEAERWRRDTIDAWNAWGLHGDSPDLMQFVATLRRGGE